MLDRTKPVQTRDGRKVEIYKWDHPGDFPIHGVIDGSEIPAAWRSDGSYGTSGIYDIINVPEPKREGWVNVYGNWTCGVVLHKSRADADHASRCGGRIACVHFTEGQFDEA